MKMKASDIIRKSSDREMAQLIGSVVAMRADGITAQQAMKIEYSKTLKILQTEMETEYVPTNADRIRAMSDEDLAKERIDRIDMYTNSPAKEFIGDFCGIVNSEEEAIKKELEWLQEKVEE